MMRSTTTNTHSAFLDALDLGDNVQRSLANLSGIRGAAALVLAIALAALDIVFWALAWHFDFQPTIAATSAFAAHILPSLPGDVAQYTGAIAILFTLTPMLMEFSLPRLAAAGFRVATYAIYLVSIFDAITDWPNVVAVVSRSGFDQFGILAWPAFYLARLVLLAFATHGFELLAVVIAVCVFKLLWQSRG
jgi:hypothetical protein